MFTPLEIWALHKLETPLVADLKPIMSNRYRKYAEFRVFRRSQHLPNVWRGLQLGLPLEPRNHHDRTLAQH